MILAFSSCSSSQPCFLFSLRLGGVVISDILTEQDRKKLVGWPLMFDDLLSLVEQKVLDCSHFAPGATAGAFLSRTSSGKREGTDEGMAGVVWCGVVRVVKQRQRRSAEQAGGVGKRSEDC